MNSVRRFLFWGALRYGCLVASDELQQSRVLINPSSTSSTTIPATSIVILGWPTHLPLNPSTSLSTNQVTGGQSVTSYVDSIGNTATTSTIFSLSPVEVSVVSPTATESPLPWTGRILTDPGSQTSIVTTSTLASESSLASSASTSLPSTVLNSSSGLYKNTTSRTSSVASTTKLTSPTSTNSIATPVSLPITSTTTFTSNGGSLSSSPALSSGSATYTLFNNVSTCSTLSPGQPVTIWSIFPNTTTTTLTVTGNWSTSFTPLPEFTPPVYCPTFSPSAIKTKSDPPQPLSSGSSISPWILPPAPTRTTVFTDSLGLSSTMVYVPVPASVVSPRVTVTSITTSKNGITQITTATLPSYGSGDGKTNKMTVDTSTVPSDTLQWSPQTEPSRSSTLVNAPTPTTEPSRSTLANAPTPTDEPPKTTLANAPPPTTEPPRSTLANAPTPITTIFAGNPAATTPITEVISGITVVANPSKATIGSQTVDIGSIPQTVTESGQVFTVLPNEIDGPSVIISIPTYTPGGIFVQSPTPTTVNGVSIELGAGGGSSVVIGGTSYNIGPSAPEQTIVEKGQTIAVGSEGIVFDSTTIIPAITPAPNPAFAATATNIAIVGGSIITAVGSSVVIIGGQTITYGPNTPATTTVFNGETIIIDSSGVIFDGSTIGGAALGPSSSQIGIVGGVSIIEVGSSLAIISGTTFTIGPGATPTTTVIANQIVSAGPDGFSDGSFTWNPFPPATQVLTAGSITFTELASSLVVIGSKTFTFGPGASPTSDVYAGQTISIGPDGIGFSTTTFTSLPTNAATDISVASNSAGAGAGAAATTSKKNGDLDLRPAFGVLGICMLITMSIGWLL